VALANQESEQESGRQRRVFLLGHSPV
jgi:hypothetical protein